MSERTENPSQEIKTDKSNEGFFSRLFGKLDDKLKDKAQKASGSSCCVGDDQGGKCC